MTGKTLETVRAMIRDLLPIDGDSIPQHVRRMEASQ